MGESLYRYAEMLDAGTSREAIRRGVAAGGLQRTTRGIYGAGTEGIHPGNRLRGMFLRLPADAVVGFQTGAQLHGFGDLRSEAIHVIVPAGTVIPQIRGVIAHEAMLPVRDPVELCGVPCAPAARCAIDLARTVRRMDALPLLDLALRSGACQPEDLHHEVLRHAKLRGVCQARRLVRLADPRAECRQESQLRLVFIDGGLPAPEPQVWVTDDFGVPLYRLDLGYRARRIGVEYDGLSHLDRDRLRHDQARMNWLAAQGWTMRHFTAYDLYRRPAYIVESIRSLVLPS